ncbi:MAG: MerR family transcriptional regulator [Desulfobacteraceae bacterium]|nr:MerR family transcriptional regulator [Desulfobacteraceae bacterium]
MKKTQNINKAINKHWTIQDVSSKLGLPKSTIRFWEKEFSEYLAPVRTAGGQRRYIEKDIEIISKINQYKHLGLSLSDILGRLVEHNIPDNDLSVKVIKQLADHIAGAVHKEIIHFFKERHIPKQGN